MLKWLCFKVWIVHELDCINFIILLGEEGVTPHLYGTEGPIRSVAYQMANECAALAKKLNDWIKM